MADANPLVSKSRDPEDPSTQLIGGQPSKAVPIFITIMACMGAFLFGMHVGFSSPTEKAIQLTQNLSKNEADLMFSLINLGAMVGCLVAAGLARALGPKRTLLLNAIPFTVASVVFSYSGSYAGLICGRIIGGAAVGLASVLVPLYVAEIAPADLRGALGCVNQLMICTGITVVNIIGLPIVDHDDFWKTLSMLMLIPLALHFIVLFVYAPESPTWLAQQGRMEDARLALEKLRGPDYDVGAELASLRAPEQNEDASIQAGPGLSSLLHPSALRPLMVGLALVLLQQWSGINSFIFYSASLFSSDDGARITSQAIEGAIAVNAVQVVFTLVAVLTMGKAGRRFFMLLSSLGMSASCGIMGYVYYADAGQGAKIAIVCVYLAFFAMGVGPVVWLVVSEIFPAAVRSTAMSVVIVVNWGSSFAVTFAFSPMKDTLNSYGVFWFYGGVLLLGAIFVAFKLPETKDKSLEEIEKLFQD